MKRTSINGLFFFNLCELLHNTPHAGMGGTGLFSRAVRMFTSAMSGQPSGASGESSSYDSDSSLEPLRQPAKGDARLVKLEHHGPERVVRYADDEGEYAVVAAPSVFAAGEGVRTVTKKMVKEVQHFSERPLALLFKLVKGSTSEYATDADGAPVAVYTMYLAQTGPRTGGGRPTMPALAPAVLKEVERRMKAEGHDPSAALYTHEGVVYPAFPSAKRKPRAAAKRAAPDDSELPSSSRAKLEKHVMGMAGAIGLQLTKGPEHWPMAVSPNATFAQVASAYMDFLTTDPRVPKETRRVAAGLAPHTRAPMKHYGTVDPRLAPETADAPYDALDMLRKVKSADMKWESEEKQKNARSAINWSVHLWNTLFDGAHVTAN